MTSGSAVAARVPASIAHYQRAVEGTNMDLTEGTMTGTGTNGMGSTLGRGVDQAFRRAHSAIDRASDAARPAIGRVAAGAHKTVDRMAGAATYAANAVEEKGERLKVAQRQMTESSSAYIRENPMTSLGLALAGGFILGRLLISR
jgi:ElaB/YqjD/DUF883 family membrane-anchored ribosome-binding protein